jgi:hypothetical protein
MTNGRFRSLSFWKKLAPLVLGGLVLGGGGAVAAQRYFGGDCCTPGSPCCHPGSPCCHGHHADPTASLAQR